MHTKDHDQGNCCAACQSCSALSMRVVWCRPTRLSAFALWLLRQYLTIFRCPTYSTSSGPNCFFPRALPEHYSSRFILMIKKIIRNHLIFLRLHTIQLVTEREPPVKQVEASVLSKVRAPRVKDSKGVSFSIVASCEKSVAIH